MERLTKTLSNNTTAFIGGNVYAAICKLADYEQTNLTPTEITAIQAELTEYKRLEADGLMVRLPCKVGDVVYEIVKYPKDGAELLGILPQTGVKVESKIFNLPYYARHIYDFGTKVFRTEAEAQQAMEVHNV